MSIIIDRLFTQPEIYSGFNDDEKFYAKLKRKRYIDIKNFMPSIILAVVFRFLNISLQYILVSTIVLYIYVTNNNIRENQKKIKLLNSIMFNDEEEPFDLQSYLELDQDIVDFYYKNRWYIDCNMTSYRKSLVSANNILRIAHNLEHNLMKYPEQLYQNAYMEYKESLNNLHSSIYKMISQPVNDDIFNDNLIILKKLLWKHIVNIQRKVIKCGYNLYDINMWSIINPSNIELEDDTKSKGYSSHYSFF
jgi:hypothetical protein